MCNVFANRWQDWSSGREVIKVACTCASCVFEGTPNKRTIPTWDHEQTRVKIGEQILVKETHKKHTNLTVLQALNGGEGTDEGSRAGTRAKIVALV